MFNLKRPHIDSYLFHLFWLEWPAIKFFMFGGHVNDRRHFAWQLSLILSFLFFSWNLTRHTGEKMNRTPKKYRKKNATNKSTKTKHESARRQQCCYATIGRRQPYEMKQSTDSHNVAKVHACGWTSMSPCRPSDNHVNADQTEMSIRVFLSSFSPSTNVYSALCLWYHSTFFFFIV